MKLFGLAGWSGSGKTTLLDRLIPSLRTLGLTVSTIKHAHHEFDIDQPGKDSHRHREAGAAEVLVTSSRRWALMHELRGAREPDLDFLLSRMSPVDVVLVEGFRRHEHPKLEVWRRETGQAWLYPSDPHIVAVAADEQPADLALPYFTLDDHRAIALFIERHLGLVGHGHAQGQQ
jgi:molybdopterin-guanine dinucleotide biosynthesis protein B